jgi:TonB-linked SusC/RagA family outer membrane protein
MKKNRIITYIWLLIFSTSTYTIQAKEQGNSTQLADNQAITEDVIQSTIVDHVTPGKSGKNIHLGYNIERKNKLSTASTDVVYSEELEKNSVINPGESLFGELTGLSVLQNGGLPWARSPSMFIRGRASFNNSDVLVLVDGFERDIESLSLLEIESVTVLKDGAALAVYGQRGANGVILVTTKRGDYESFNVDVSFDRGFHSPFRIPDLLNGYDYARAVNEAAFLDGTPAVYSDWELERYRLGDMPLFYSDVNWWDETLKDFGTTANFNSSFYGGGRSSKYFVSLNYQEEDGLLDNTDLDERYNSELRYNRFNFRTNLDVHLTTSTLLQVNLAGVIDNRRWPGVNVNDRIMDALYSVPSGVFPVRTVNDNWGGSQFYDNNPVALVSSTGHRLSHRRELNANGRIFQDLSAWIPGLSAEVAAAYDNLAIYNEGKTRGFLYERTTLVREAETNAVIDTLTSRFGSDTDLSAYDNFGGQRRHATGWGRLNYATSWGFNSLNTALLYTQDKRVNDGQYNTFLRQTLAATATYMYQNKYIVDAVLSYSGSSVFQEGNRFGLFPAISAAWILSQEDFLEGSNLIDFLKLRASWGISGSDLMSPNLYDQPFAAGGTYYFTNNNNSFGGFREGRLASRNLTHETARKIGVGIDALMLERLDLSIDLFHENRSNILTTTDGSIPGLIGVSRPFESIGEVVNKGIETSMMWRDQVRDFKYHIGGSFAFARNEIIEMSEPFRPFDYLWQTGNPVGQNFGLEAIGFFRDENDIANSPAHLFSPVRPGDIKYRDQNGDGIIDELDMVPIGYAGGYPEIYFSMKLGFEYRGFGIDALFQGIANQTLYLSTQSVFWPLRGQASISTFSDNRWTPQTAESATLPRLSLLENANNYQRNDIWLAKGDYLKLRRLDIYYDLPANLANMVRLNSARVFVRGMNLFSIDDIEIVDPESIRATYPTLSSFHVGINVGF